MARRPPKPPHRTPAPQDRAELLRAWARQTLARDCAALRPQLGHLRVGMIERYGLDPKLGPEELAQAAAIFYRTVEVDEGLGLLAPIEIIDDAPRPGVGRGGIMPRVWAALFARGWMVASRRASSARDLAGGASRSRSTP